MDFEERCKFLEDKIKRLNKIGIALSSESDIDVLLELILDEAKYITNSDGRTLYMLDKAGHLKFEILRNDTLNLVMGGTSGIDINFDPISVYDKDGNPNHHNVSAHVAITGKTINIKDAYFEKGFDFSGPKAVDKKMNYRSKSFLTVPLKNHENDIIGVIQLINAKDSNTGEIIEFTEEMESQINSISSQGAVALTNRKLIEELKDLFESFIKLIATAIDKKSEYTGGHCERVPVITMMLANAAEKVKYGEFENFSMTADERYELHIAAWLHDCGKVATPVHIVDKSTKLETIFDRIELIKTRFEILKRDAEIKFLKEKIKLMNLTEVQRIDELENKFNSVLQQLDDDLKFLENSNIGGEFMTKEDQERVMKIADYNWVYNNIESSFLSENEYRNLTISKGTLLPEDREIINDHITITIDMLEQLPYPKQLKNVPEFAGGHHEKLDGSGYPKGLTGDEMPLQAKMLVIADIFEALTADDRPYKDGMNLSQAMEILSGMSKNNKIDSGLFEIFVKEGIYKQYAELHVKASQIDSVDESALLN